MAIENLRYRNEFDFGNPNKLVANVNTDVAVTRFENEVLAFDSTLTVKDYIKVVTDGTYADFEQLKHIDLKTGEVHEEEVNFVNIKAYPNATREEAHLSAFAVVRQLNDDGVYETNDEKELLKNHYSKCMRIIYALNDDAHLKNMLQYGYVGTNYTFVTNQKHENTNYINLNTNQTVKYEMNNIHTGNPFISYYCNDISWDEDTHNNWLRQNADAETPANKLNTEASNVTFDSVILNGTSFDLPKYGADFSDVTIAWSSNNAYATIENGSIVFINNTENPTVDVVIKATLTCAGASLEKTFEIKVELESE
jgi:hypothetical protein